MRKDLEAWAETLVLRYDWRERSTWFNVRLRDMERFEQRLKRVGPDLIEDRCAHLEDALDTIHNWQATLDTIAERLQAVVEFRAAAA